MTTRVKLLATATVLTVTQVLASGSAGSASVTTTPRSPARMHATATVNALPSALQGFGDELVCPGPSVCVATAYVDDKPAVATRTGATGAWSVAHWPAPAGAEVYVAGVQCLNEGFCFAWGGTPAPTVWTSTAPASGSWQVRPLEVPLGSVGSVSSMDCTSANLCVAVAGLRDAAGNDYGLAWSTQDPVSGPWASAPLSEAYRLNGVSCVSAACVATGDVHSGQTVEPSLWTTENVLAGVWSRVRPLIEGTALPYTIGAPACLSATFCYANGSSFAGNAYVYTVERGYWVSTAPHTEDWIWHATGGDGAGPLRCATPSTCLLKDNDSLWFDVDATDSSLGTRFLMEAQYGPALTGFFCRGADSCLAWGSDSGSASQGPLMAGKVWQGSPSGTVLGATPLPTPPGDADLLPRAYDIACSTVCVAIGSLSTLDFYDSRPMVWVGTPDGTWAVSATASTTGDTTSGTRISSRISLKVADARAAMPRFVGKVRAASGCAKARKVKLIGKNRRPAVTVKTDNRGRYRVKLTSRLRTRLGARTYVKVGAKTTSASVKCMPARSVKVKVPRDRPRRG